MANELTYTDPKEAATSMPTGQDTAATAKIEGEISLLDLLIVLAERKHIIFWVTVAFALLAIIVSLLLPVRYTATLTLMPPQEKSSVSGALASELGGLSGLASLAGGSLGLKNPNDMYVAMLKSQTVEDAMVHRYGLMQEYHKKLLSDARKEFEHDTTVDGDSKDGLIHISIEDANPQRAAELVNGYVDQFRALSEHLAISEASQRRLFFQQQLEQAKDKLNTAEEALVETERKTGLIALNSQAAALIQSATALRAQIAAKEVEIQGMQAYATSENAQLIEAQQELEGLRAQLAKLGGSEESGDSLMVPKGLVPTAGLEYVRRLRDVKYYQTIYDILAQQCELARLDEAKEGALIQVVDPAIPPERKSSPKRGLIVIGSTFLGFLVGVFFAFGQAGLRRMKEVPEIFSKLTYLRRLLSVRTHSTLHS